MTTRDDEKTILVCDPCRDDIRDRQLQVCHRCGARGKIPLTFEDQCRVCRPNRWHFERAISLGNYQNQLRQAVLNLKRRGQGSAARQMGRLLAQQEVCHAEFFDALTALVYIPVQWRRSLLPKENVAEMIAEGVADVTGLPLVDDALEYNRVTKKQGRLSVGQRFANLESAVSVRTRIDLADHILLIVDDVMTSGATASAAAKALYRSGAKTVFVATIARGVGIY